LYRIPSCFSRSTALEGGIFINRNEWLSSFGGRGGRNGMAASFQYIVDIQNHDKETIVSEKTF